MPAVITGILILFLLAGVYVEYPGYFPYAVVGIVAVILVGLFYQSVRRALMSLADPIREIETGVAMIATQANRVQEGISTIRREKGLDEVSALYSRFFGTLIFSVLSIGLVLSDLYLIVATMRLVVPGETVAELPFLTGLDQYMAWVLGVMVAVGGLMWGMYISDMSGKTNYSPNHDLDSDQKVVLRRKAIVMITLFLLLLALLGVYRNIGVLDAGQDMQMDEMAIQDSVNLDLDALMAEQTMAASYEEEIVADASIDYLQLSINLLITVLVFLTVIASDWVGEWLFLYTVIIFKKLTQYGLRIIWFAATLLRSLIALPVAILVAAGDFLLRIAAFIALPFSTILGSKYADQPQDDPFWNRGGEGRAENKIDSDNSEQSEVPSARSQEHNDEPVMFVSDDPEPVMHSQNHGAGHQGTGQAETDEPEPEMPNRNWSPYQA